MRLWGLDSPQQITHEHSDMTQYDKIVRNFPNPVHSDLMSYFLLNIQGNM